MPLTEDEERELRMEQMRADIELKKRQFAWESPKAIAAIVAATAVIVGTVAGLVGFRLGQMPSAPPVSVHIEFPPGTVIQVPPAPAPAQK